MKTIQLFETNQRLMYGVLYSNFTEGELYFIGRDKELYHQDRGYIDDNQDELLIISSIYEVKYEWI